jgi:uncharacterized membrane protein YfcA
LCALFALNQAQADQEEELTCAVDTDCPLYPYYICDLEAELSKCFHKSIFPIYIEEFFGLIILPILLAFANVGGIGGGGLIIPITMALFRFSTKEAIALSGFTILTGAIVRWIYQWSDKHPKKDSTLIEYPIVIVMMPMVLVGSFVGVIINLYFPAVLLCIILTLLLIFLSVQSLFNGRDIYRKETIEIRKKKLEETRKSIQLL